MKPRSGSNQDDRTTPWFALVNGRVRQDHSRRVNGARVTVHRNLSRSNPKWWVQIDVPFQKGTWRRVWPRPTAQKLETVRRFADRQAKLYTEALRGFVIENGMPGVRSSGASTWAERERSRLAKGH